MRFVLATALLFGCLAKTKADAPVWSDLPWSDLEANLSPSASLLQMPDSADRYTKECYPEYLKEYMSRSQHNLVDQPSGLCMNQLYCAFDRCNPLPLTTEEAAKLPPKERWDKISASSNLNIIEDVKTWLDSSNPAYNLPSTVLFPTIAGDVTAAVRFAGANDIGISVKNSGHHYMGASTKKDTININMGKYVQYSSTGVMECSDNYAPADANFQSDLSDQPCRLARARGKPAVLRVGGGEDFGEVYISIRKFNEKQPDGSIYHLVGGAAGTVSPLGWTFQGGLAGTTGGRQYGFGVDQVIQVEMVLPSGVMARFGPTQWEDGSNERYIYPQTTAVSGVCLTNPEEPDEANWVWNECEDDIDFDGLWFAVNGGGGGTWGIVTSIYLQLHDYGRLEAVTNGIDYLLSDACGLPSEHKDIFEKEWWNFYIEFMFDPSAVGVTREESNRCSSSTYNYLLCFGENSSKPYTRAWTRYIRSRRQTLKEAGVDSSTIKLAAGCTGIVDYFIDWADRIINKEGPLKGKADDFPKPSYMSTSERDVNLLVPSKYILENRDAAREFVLATVAAPYCAFGGDAGFATDGANSLSKAHRLGGWMLIVDIELALTDSFYANDFPKMFDTTDKNNFPGFIGGNHAGPNTFGPLKDDWTKACPFDWTQEERDNKCISIQESIWGTETLKRLESVKESIDPDYIFDCYGCAGNNRGLTPQPKKTIAEIVVDVSSTDGFDNNKFDYDILLKALETADLVDVVADPDADLTVFAPRDKAFFRFAVSLGYPGQGNYDEEAIWNFIVGALTELGGGDPIPVLTNVLLYHVSPGTKDSDNIRHIANTGEMIPTFLEDAMIKPRGINGMVLEDAATSLPNPRLTDPVDIKASNGIIHTIKYVLVPVPL